MCHCRILSCLCSHSWLVTQPFFYFPLWQSTHTSAFTPNGNVLIKDSWHTPCLAMPGRTQAVLILPSQQRIQRDFFASWISCVSLDCPVHICNSSQPGLSAHGSLKARAGNFFWLKSFPSAVTQTLICALCTFLEAGTEQKQSLIWQVTSLWGVNVCNSLCFPQEWGSWKSPKMRLWPEEFAL